MLSWSFYWMHNLTYIKKDYFLPWLIVKFWSYPNFSSNIDLYYIRQSISDEFYDPGAIVFLVSTRFSSTCLSFCETTAFLWSGFTKQQTDLSLLPDFRNK